MAELNDWADFGSGKQTSFILCVKAEIDFGEMYKDRSQRLTKDACGYTREGLCEETRK